MVKVIRLQTQDIEGAIAVLQEAFTNDPYNTWAFDKTRFDSRRNKESLRLRCEWGIRNALFYVAKDERDPTKVIGIAMWLPPSAGATWTDYFESWRLWLGQLYLNVMYMGRGGLRVKRYWIWKEKQAEAQSELWTDPEGYFFCNMVAVSPHAQGQGVGKALFKAVTDEADRQGRMCYLEASPKPANTAIYKRLGFEIVKHMDCDDDGEKCILICMMREPQAIA